MVYSIPAEERSAEPYRFAISIEPNEGYLASTTYKAVYCGIFLLCCRREYKRTVRQGAYDRHSTLEKAGKRLVIEIIGRYFSSGGTINDVITAASKAITITVFFFIKLIAVFIVLPRYLDQTAQNPSRKGRVKACLLCLLYQIVLVEGVAAFGAELRGCSGSAGTQPHLSHLYFLGAAGFDLPHSAQNLPVGCAASARPA